MIIYINVNYMMLQLYEKIKLIRNKYYLLYLYNRIK